MTKTPSPKEENLVTSQAKTIPHISVTPDIKIHSRHAVDDNYFTPQSGNSMTTLPRPGETKRLVILSGRNNTGLEKCIHLQRQKPTELTTFTLSVTTHRGPSTEIW
jgi:hypothetical protein